MALNFSPIKYLKSIFERPEDDDKRKMLVAPGVVIDVPNRPINPTTPSVGAVAREIPGAVKKTATQLVEPLKTGSNNAKKVLKTVGNTLTSSTQKFGNTIGTSLALSGQQEMLDETTRRNEELSNTTLNLIKQRRAQGKDVTNLVRQYQSITGNVPTIEELNPTIKKTNLQVLGEAGGTLLEATSAGSFSKGAKSFQLAQKSSMAPAVISSAAKAVTKKEALKQAGKSIAVGAAQGYTYDVSSNLQEGKTGAEAFKPGLGTAVGASVPALSSAVGLARTEASLQIKDLIKKGYAKDEAEKIVKEGGYFRLFESPKLRELGDKINELNSKMVNAPNKTLQARYKKAYEQAVKQYKKEQQGGFVKLFEGVDDKSDVVKKEMKFLDTVKKSPVVSSETKEAINELPNRFQTPITNKETLSKAQARVNQSTEGALSYVMSNDKPDEETIATGIELMRKYRAAGNTQLEADIAGNVAEKLTKAGRTVQAASIFNRLSPDGVLVYAQRQIQKVQSKSPGKLRKVEKTIEDLIPKLGKANKDVSDQVVEEIRKELPDLAKLGKPKLNPPKPRANDAEFKALFDRIAAEDSTDKAASALAGKIAPTKKPRKPDPLKEMVNELYRVAKEVLPEKKKPVQKNPLDFIREAIKNKDEYKDVWLKAQDIVRQRYSDKPEQLALLNKYFDTTLLSGATTHAGLPVAESRVTGAIRRGMKESGVDLNTLVREHYSGTQKAGKDLTNKLIDELGIPAKDAIQLSQRIERRFQELATQKKQAILAGMFKDRTSKQKNLTQRLIELSNLGGFDDPKYRKLISEKFGLPTLDEPLAKKLKDLANQAQSTDDLIVRDELQNELRSALSSLTTAGLGKRVATAQTIAQLLNPKTMIRNTIGNEIFWRLERANKYLATPIDIVRSKLTGGPRTVTFRTGADWNEFFNPTKDYLTGLKKGAKAGLEGRSLTPTQSDFNPGLTFTSKWNPASWFERSMKATLGGFDQAAFNRARNQTIGELSYLRALNEGLKGKAAKEAAKKYAKNIDQNVLDLANEYGKYVTYQDDNILSTGLGKVKRALNLGKDFGVGDLIIKYPKTPGAIMMRAIEYSPAGILKSAYELGKAYKNGTPGAEKATLALSRAITGTLGLTGMGYILADKGIIIGKSEEDKDIKATRKETGVTKYQVNLSALERFVKSNFKDSGGTKPGDKLYSYDWAQPIAVSISMGANANKNVKAGERVSGGLGATVSNSITGGVETLTEQPVISGVNRIFQGQGVADTAIDTAKQLPASFVPTALSQVNQFQDNTSRTTYDPSPVQEAWNRAKAKIPGVSKSLPEQKTILGETAKRYEDNTFFNVFTNPAFENTYKERPEIKMVLDIYERSGETKQAPRVVGKTAEVTRDGKSENIKLTPKEQQALQATIGSLTQDVFYKLSAGEQKDRFAALPDEKKAAVMADILSDISQAARIQVLGHRPDPKGVSDRARKYSRELKADPDLQQYLFTRTP